MHSGNSGDRPSDAHTWSIGAIDKPGNFTFCGYAWSTRDEQATRCMVVRVVDSRPDLVVAEARVDVLEPFTKLLRAGVRGIGMQSSLLRRGSILLFLTMRTSLTRDRAKRTLLAPLCFLTVENIQPLSHPLTREGRWRRALFNGCTSMCRLTASGGTITREGTLRAPSPLMRETVSRKAMKVTTPWPRKCWFFGSDPRICRLCQEAAASFSWCG